MKKIIIFSTAYFPFIGGAEIAVKEIADRINDFQFDLITARMDRKLMKIEQIGKVKVYRVGPGFKSLDKFLLPFLGYVRAKRLHKKQSYNLIWSIMASQASIAASLLKRKYKDIKLLLTLQEGDEEEHLKRYAFKVDFLYKLLIRPWHLLVFKKADYLSVISRYLKDRAVKNGVRVPIEVIPNAVDINHFSREYPANELNILKEKLGKKKDDIYLITTSRLVLKNAIDDVIKALTLLPGNVNFLILGTGPDENKLKNLASELKVVERVKFLGQIDHKDLPKYLNISDIFVRPSLSEGLGNSFLEAMAAGIPVIGTPKGGIPDFLYNGETGLFCQAKNPKSIAEKVQLLVSDNKLKEKLICNGKALVAERYDWQIVAKKMDKIFIKLTQ